MDGLKLVKGNDFTTIIEVKAYKYNGEEITDFDLKQCTDIKIRDKADGSTKSISTFDVLDDNKLQISWDGPSMALGKHTLEVVGKFNDLDWRFYDKEPVFTIVNSNSEANVPESSIVKEDTYQIDGKRVYIICPKGDRGAMGPRGLRGYKGDKGDTGEQGPQGEQGPAGMNGRDGHDGIDGTDGHSPVIASSKYGNTTFIYSDGVLIATILDGQDGQMMWGL